MDFDILIGKPCEDGSVVVSAPSLIQRCDNMEQARVYARGVQDGYRAAKARLGAPRTRYDQ